MPSGISPALASTISVCASPANRTRRPTGPRVLSFGALPAVVRVVVLRGISLVVREVLASGTVGASVVLGRRTGVFTVLTNCAAFSVTVFVLSSGTVCTGAA